MRLPVALLPAGLLAALIPAGSQEAPAAQAAAPPAAAEAPADAAALLAAFARIEGLEARFSEEKQLALLAAPLTSRGRLYFLPPGYLTRRVEQPQASMLTITPSELRMTGPDGVETIELAQNDDLRVFVTSLVRVFTGDRDALERSFTLDYSTDGPRWTLTLTPRKAPLSEMLRDLVLRGEGPRPVEIEVREPGGDRTVTRVEQADVERRFTDEEKAELFGIRPRG